MAKLGFASLLAVFIATLTLVAVTSHDASAGKPCSRAKFETKLVADACKKGGQDEAKKVMKAWLKEAKKKQAATACQTCHSKVGGAYPLKPTGLKAYKDLGGL